MVKKRERKSIRIDCIFFCLQTKGPIHLKDSLTNGTNAFQKECIDLFHIEDKDIGDPIAILINLEPKG